MMRLVPALGDSKGEAVTGSLPTGDNFRYRGPPHLPSKTRRPASYGCRTTMATMKVRNLFELAGAPSV